MEISITPLAPEEIPAAASVLGRAFATQPSTLAIYKNASDGGERVGRIFGAMLRHMDGEAFAARAGAAIVGAMRIVRWPGCQLRFTQALKMLPTLLTTGGPGSMRRGMKMRSTWAAKDPPEPHWHLDPLGVSPDWQGRGVGSRLMGFYLARVDASGLPAYHETDRPENLAFYAKHGFHVIGQETILGFDTWYMRREAASRG